MFSTNGQRNGDLGAVQVVGNTDDTLLFAPQHLNLKACPKRYV